MLLQLDPNKRPSATEIIVRARMQANPDAIQATAPLERDALIPVGTIQLARLLTFNGGCLEQVLHRQTQRSEQE